MLAGKSCPEVLRGVADGVYARPSLLRYPPRPHRPPEATGKRSARATDSRPVVHGHVALSIHGIYRQVSVDRNTATDSANRPADNVSTAVTESKQALAWQRAQSTPNNRNKPRRNKTPKQNETTKHRHRNTDPKHRAGRVGNPAGNQKSTTKNNENRQKLRDPINS